MEMQHRQRNNGAGAPLVTPPTRKGPCDEFAHLNLTPQEQREIADLAFSIWLDRAFRHGSPREDWIEALRQRSERQ